MKTLVLSIVLNNKEHSPLTVSANQPVVHRSRPARVKSLRIERTGSAVVVCLFRCRLSVVVVHALAQRLSQIGALMLDVASACGFDSLFYNISVLNPNHSAP